MKNPRAAILFRLEHLWEKHPEKDLCELLRAIGGGTYPTDKVLTKKLAGIARGWDKE